MDTSQLKLSRIRLSIQVMTGDFELRDEFLQKFLYQEPVELNGLNYMVIDRRHVVTDLVNWWAFDLELWDEKAAEKLNLLGS
jgi:hypothetical protein